MKKILLTLDPSVYTKTALKYAKDISSENEPKITGVAVIDIMNISEYNFSEIPILAIEANKIDKKIKNETAEIEDLKKKCQSEISSFKRFCKKNGMNYDSKIYYGRPKFVFEEESKYYDLVITGLRNRFHIETKEEPEKLLTEYIENTTTPILAVPGEYKPIKNVLFAFDGSLPSIRAIKSFLSLIKNTDYNLTVLIEKENSEEALLMLDKIGDYIKMHKNIKINKVHTKKSIIKVFNESYINNTDLVVCGINSKNFIQKIFIGSFPKHIINLNKIPILIG